MGFEAKVTTKGTADKELRKVAVTLGSKIQVVAGLPKKSAPYPDSGVSVVLVGATHEFGSKSRNIPPRPFLRPTLRKHKNKYKDMARVVVRKAIKQQITLAVGAGKIGLEMQGDIIQTITKLDSPKLAERTIKEKARTIRNKGKKAAAIAGAGNPLIDTGHMRQSIRFEVRKRRS